MVPQAVLNKLNSLNPKSVTKTIGTGTWRFYSFRPPMLAEILAIGRDAVGSFLALTDGDRVHRATKSKENRTSDKSGFENVTLETEVSPTSLEHIRVATENRKRAAQELYDAFLGNKSRNFLARIVVDALREDFPNDTYEDADIMAFWNKLDLESMIEMVRGAVEANALVLRPFLEKVGLSFKTTITDAVRARLAELPGLSGTRASTTPAPSSSDSSSESSPAPVEASPGETPSTLIS
jgi:hypothetical protein